MLKLELLLDEINYNALIESLLPKLLEDISKQDNKLGKVGQLLMDMKDYPIQMITAALDTLPQKSKNELIVNLISIYNEDITKGINHILEKQQISADVLDIKLNNI
ncbi:hypothetical protein I5677_10595 [Mobilitalea sibirica]|uniref:Uncharacterized protein n=1 Tax=Mobilitalea sibirica TaxID=1462919 RepID=A0A8J7H7T6_9FIRM|nr:hypothetical protein [Mobilitalea sibirica]MBH1941341.1 hypothetical protein [Mobilitalea sibirica]